MRSALTQGIDIQALNRDLLGSLPDGSPCARSCVSTITPSAAAYHHQDLKALPYAPAKARAQLESQGWSDGDGDGIRDRAGRAFQFELVYNEGNVLRKDIAERVQKDLAAIGVRAVPTARNIETWKRDLAAGDFDALILGWKARLEPDPRRFWHSQGSKNFVGYDNPEADRLLEQALASSDPAETAKIHRQLQVLVYADQPFTFLHWRRSISAVSNRFSRVQANLVSPYYHLEQWRVAGGSTP